MRKKLFWGLNLIVWVGVGVGIWSFLGMITEMLIKRPGAFLNLPELEPATETFVESNPLGQKIAAKWYQGKPGAGAVILCHGHGASQKEFRAVLPFLRKAGFGVLSFDFRAHGESGGEFTAIGLHEWEDIQVVLRGAEARGFLPPGTPLGAYGRSMGAAALVNGAEKLPRIKAFILESLHYDLRGVAVQDVRNVFGLPDNFLIDLVFRIAQRKTGIDYYSSRPGETVRNIAPRPLLLIHDVGDIRIPLADFQRIARNATWSKTLLFQKAPHVGAHGAEPAKFEQECVGFLASAGITVP